PSINFRRPFTPMHPEGTFASEPAESARPWTPHAGVWASYGNDLVEVRSLDDSLVASPLKHQLVADVFTNWSFDHGLAAGVVVPVGLYQSGGSSDVAGLPDEVPEQSLGDVVLRIKAAMFGHDAAPTAPQGFGLALEADGSLPT